MKYLFLIIVMVTGCLADASERMGVVRTSPGGVWSLLDDKNHSPIGLVSVTQTNDYVEVFYQHTCTQVFSAAVTPDESLAALDIRVGASVRLESVRVYLYGVGGRITPSTVTGNGINFFVKIWCE